MQPSIGLGGCCRTIAACGHTTTTHSSNNFTIFYEYLLGAEIFKVQFRTHLRKSGAHVVLDWPRPTDLDTQENTIPMNAQQRRTFNDEVAEYNQLDNIVFSDLMKACHQNLKGKTLSETSELNRAFELLQRLRQHYYTVDDITKAKHILNYHALTQGKYESGAEFVDRELREYLALRDMGVQIDDSIPLTKFIQ